MRHRRWTAGSLDWVVWLAAIALSAWQIWISRFAIYVSRNGRLYELITNVGLSAVVLFFDAALIVHAIKARSPEVTTE